MSLGLSLVCIASQVAEVDGPLVVLEPQACSLDRLRIHRRERANNERAELVLLY